MMNGIEPLADAVTGGVIGRAVEPGAGELTRDGHTTERSCLNCGAQLVGDYCHACGQRAHVHRSLHAFAHDLLHGVFHFEGKIWRTLPMLVWRPGELTRRYIEGQRATFVSPIALFLFSVFLMFAAVSLFSGIGHLPEEAKKDIAEQIRAEQVKLTKLQTERDAALKANQPTARLEEKIAESRKEISAMNGVRAGNVDQMGIGKGLPGWIGGGISRAAKNPELIAYKLKTNAYKFSWMIIPLSVPFVWLLFPFSRRFRLYDHTVFVTYSLCFMSLLVIAGLLLGAAGITGFTGLIWLLPPFHMYRQLKGAYGLGRASALWRTAVLTIFAIIVTALFSAVLVGVGTYD